MEVFLRNLPVDLTDRSLQSHLKPFLDNLSIQDGSYQCDKKKKKGFGNITFLREADGRRFLERHGEEIQHVANGNIFNHQNGRYNGGRPAQNCHPTKAGLSLMNRPVFCTLSNRQPSKHALESIQYQLDQMEEQRKHMPKKVDDTAIVFAATDVACGYWKYVDGTLTFVSEWTAGRGTCSAKFTKRNLLIKIPSMNTEVRISFPNIHELVWSETGVALTLNLSPTFLTLPPSAEIVEMLQLLSFGGKNIADQRIRLKAIDDNHALISNVCFVYYFKIQTPTNRNGHAFESHVHQLRKLKRRDLFEVNNAYFGFQQSTYSIHAALTVFRKRLNDYNTSGALSFRFLFMLQHLVYDGFLHPVTVGELAARLASLFKASKETQLPISEEAFKRLFKWIGYPYPDADESFRKCFEVDGIMEYLHDTETEIRGGLAVDSELFRETENLVRIYRAYVTPTRIYLNEGMEAKNRILRKFPQHHDHFLRVQFSDENGQDLYFSPKISLDPIYDRFKSVLANGISIGARKYGFLGFSHSSLRSHSVWLSAPFFYDGHLQIPQLIITSLGEFRNIRSPARRAARIGQAFSETPYTVSLDEFGIQVNKIPDVERNGRVFSDGVAPMSWQVMEAIHSVIPQSKGFPTCVQFRWAGAKGMLALDYSLPESQFCIRPSQEKFQSSDKLNLEICDLASKPIPLVLNRQLVKILEDMDAPESWFLELQDKELVRLRGITATVYNTATFLKLQSVGDAIQLPRLLRQADMMGVDYKRDPFLYAVVNAVVLKELRLLKHKARIPVAQGITLFGVMDETGFLADGQVYVTYDTMSGRHEVPPENEVPVIVTRSPALHPGDIQVAQNTVPPAGHPLSHLSNCIVFSQYGSRDLPSQLSGGDLDGDVFNVIWDPEVADVVRTFSPADYARVDPLELRGPVESSDMANFFIDFMKTDHLGVVATRHMILADQRKEGTLDLDCKALAELHSSAVDFSKTGRAVELKQLPMAPKWRPDFLAPGPQVNIHDKSDIQMDQYVHKDDGEEDEDEDGPRHRYYYSERILGKLYRAVDEQKIWNEHVRRNLPSGGASFWDQLIVKLRERVMAIGPIEWQHRTEEAKRLRHAYDDAIWGLMVEHSDHPSQPLRELEVFAGFIINKSGAQTRRQRDRSTQLKDEFERITSWITKQMREPVSSLGTGFTSELDALELCLACVYVGCLREERQILSYARTWEQEMESFRVVAACALLKELNLPERSMNSHSRSGGYVGVR